MEVWRIQSVGKEQFFLENRVAAIGWAAEDKKSKIITKEIYLNTSVSKPQKKLFLDLENHIDDLIWMRSKGHYFLARIEEESKWSYNKMAENVECASQISNLNWIPVGDESDVPGIIPTSFIRGFTLQRIHDEGAVNFSQSIFNEKKNALHYHIESFSLSYQNFFRLISPTDCEDLIYSYLFYYHHTYMCIPSTNKISTPLYEFVALDTKTGSHIYIQSKNSDHDLNTNDYKHLVQGNNNKVYLFSRGGNVLGSKIPGIYEIKKEKLFNFAWNKKHEKYLPPKIIKWISFLRKNTF